MNYQPTQEQKEGLKIKEGELLLSGDRVFHTIQGEGDTVGLPTTFIRLHHCNLACSWCDTPYTWNRNTEEFYTEPVSVRTEDVRDLVIEAQQEKGVEELVRNIVITGGEPLIQQGEIVKLVEANPDFKFWVETNGTLMPNERLLELASVGSVSFNCSPKLLNSGMGARRAVKPDVLRTLDSLPSTVFKFVCSSPEDIEEIQRVYALYISKHKVMIMPEGRTEDANNEHLKLLISIIMRKGLRITPRLQNTLFDGKRAT